VGELRPLSDRVEWEMVVRYPWDDETAIELRVLTKTEVEITVTAKNAAGGATGSRMVKFADLRRALDELERSATEIEALDG
jgi:hypothetical protein